MESPSLVRDLSGEYNADLSAHTGIQWDYTKFDNEGEIPALSGANKELHLCEDGLVWSKG